MTAWTYFVEDLEIANRRQLFSESRKLVLEVSNEHSELSAPVTQVVELEDVVTDKLAQSSDAVADNGGPERAHKGTSCMSCLSTI